MINLSWIGLIIIIISWIIQITKRKQISPYFLGLQALGIFFIIAATYKADLTLAILNGLSALGAIILLVLIKK